MNEQRSVFRVIGDWLEDNWVEALSGLFAFLFGILSVVFGDEAIKWMSQDEVIQKKLRVAVTVGLAASAVGYIVFFIWSLTIKERTSQLKVRLGELEDEAKLLTENIRNLLDGYLFNLASHKLGFGSRVSKCERITLYVQDSGKCFVPVGRYASNPDNQSRGRTSYPINQGCIHEAWANGWYFDDSFPDPVEDSTGYIAKHAMFGVPKTTADKLTMKSRQYCGCRIMDERGKHPIAVLVVESTDQGRFTETELRDALSNGEQQYLSNMVQTLLPYIALPSDAEKAGF